MLAGSTLGASVKGQLVLRPMFDRFPAGVLPGAVDYYITGPLQRRRAAAITKVQHSMQHSR
jgi:hypothetical protein